MKVSYSDLMSPGFGLVFSAPCTDYEKAKKIIALKRIVMSHLRTFDEVKNKFAKSFKLQEGEVVDNRHPKFPDFFTLMNQEVEIEFKKKIKMDFIKGLSANDIVILDNFIEFKTVKGEENEKGN